MTKRDILKIIRQNCIACCCGNQNEVKLCPAEKCPLHPLRFGRDPEKRKISPEQRELLMKNLTCAQKKQPPGRA